MRVRKLGRHMNRFARIATAVILASGFATALASPASAAETTGFTYANSWYKTHPGSVDFFIQRDVPTYLEIPGQSEMMLALLLFDGLRRSTTKGKFVVRAECPRELL